MADISPYKEKLYSEFTSYANQFKARMQSDAGPSGAKIIDTNDLKYKDQFSIPSLDQIKESRLKPEQITVPEYENMIQAIQSGFTLSGASYPGFEDMYESRSLARWAGLAVIFTTKGLSRYIQSNTEYGSTYGEKLTDDTDPNWSFTRKEQMHRAAAFIYYSERARWQSWFISRYRWETRFSVAFQKAPTPNFDKDMQFNKDLENKYLDELALLETKYGTRDSNDSNRVEPVGADFSARYGQGHWDYVVNGTYDLEEQLMGNNSAHSSNYFTELVEGDRILRRTRGLGRLFEQDQKTKEWGDLKQSVKNDLWGEILASKDRLMKWATVEQQTFKEPLDYLDKIFSYEDPQTFYISIKEIFPVYQIMRPEATGIMVPFFKWSPAVLLVRDLWIHLIFEGDDKLINKYLRVSSTSEPVESDRPKRGFFKSVGSTLFGSTGSTGFKSETFNNLVKPEDVISSINTTNTEIKKESELTASSQSGINPGTQDQTASGSISSTGSAPEAINTSSPAGSTTSSIQGPGSSGSPTNINNNSTTINNLSNNVVPKNETSVLNSTSNINQSNVNQSIGSAGGTSTVQSESNSVSQTGPSISTSNVNNENVNITGDVASNTLANSSINPIVSNSVINNSTEGGSNTSVSNAGTSINQTTNQSGNTSTESISNTTQNQTIAQVNPAETIIERGNTQVSTSSNVVNQGSTNSSTLNNPVVDNSSGPVSNVSNQTGETVSQSMTNNNPVTNNTNNERSPVINNIDMSEMVIRLKRIEEALLSPLEVKVIEA